MRHLLGSLGGDHKEEDVKKVRHESEVRRRRISKLEDMRRAAVLDEDEDLFEYADNRLRILKRLEQEAELIRMANQSGRSSDGNRA